VIQVNEETGNRRPVMLSVLTTSDKEAQATSAKDHPVAGPSASDADGESKQSVKGINSIMCIYETVENMGWLPVYCGLWVPYRHHDAASVTVIKCVADEV